MKLYAGAIIARKNHKEKVQVSCMALAVLATSEEEARGVGIKIAEKHYSRCDDYEDHQVEVVEVPQSLLDAVK